MVRALLASLCLVGLMAGCTPADTADVTKETSVAEAKGKVDSTMSKEQQDDLSAKVKAWDPKKDKKK